MCGSAEGSHLDLLEHSLHQDGGGASAYNRRLNASGEWMQCLFTDQLNLDLDLHQLVESGDHHTRCTHTEHDLTVRWSMRTPRRCSHNSGSVVGGNLQYPSWQAGTMTLPSKTARRCAAGDVVLAEHCVEQNTHREVRLHLLDSVPISSNEPLPQENGAIHGKTSTQYCFTAISKA